MRHFYSAAKAVTAFTALTYNFTFSDACRADNENASSDAFAERLGSSVSVSCTASCLRRESAIKIRLERERKTTCGRIRAICDNGVAIPHACHPGNVTPDCSALVQNVSLNAKLVAKFEISEFKLDFEGRYYCFVDYEGVSSSYPVSIYLQSTKIIDTQFVLL